MKTIPVICFIFLTMFCGCAYKNYSKEKPDNNDLVGIWKLREKSRQSVEASCGCRLSDSDGFLNIKQDGTIIDKGSLVDRNLKPLCLAARGHGISSSVGKYGRLNFILKI